MATQPQTLSPAEAAGHILQIATGYWLSQALFAAARLGIADQLRDGPLSTEVLAERTGCHGPTLYRVLRALAGAGVFLECSPRQFAQTPLSEALRSDVPHSIRAMVLFQADHLHWRCYGAFSYCVETGKPAFPHVFGKEPFEYLAEHPDDAKVFHEAMTSHSRMAAEAIAEAYDFSRYRTIVDVGGGGGLLLGTVLQKAPEARGVLFDLPHTVEQAKQAGLLPEGRCEFVAGDFFQSVPAGGDLYLVKHIIHDWDEERAEQILRTCRRAMSDEARLLILEMIVPEGNGPSFAKMLDLEMLVIAGGRERTEAEYAELLAKAGFRLERAEPTASPVSILEAAPL
jgi:hypothetical protein